MTYVDGFLIPVPTARLDAYAAMAVQASALFVEYGALRVVENVSDEAVPGAPADFRDAVDARAGERVILSWIVWPDKAVRDAGTAKAMADPRFAEFGPNPLFNDKRMICGGFTTLLKAGG